MCQGKLKCIIIDTKPFLVQNYLKPITYREYTPLGRDAGEIAIEHGISREEQDTITVVNKKTYQE